MEVRWQDIIKKIQSDAGLNASKRLVLTYYESFESSVSFDCNIEIPSIGSFKGSVMGGIRERAILKYKAESVELRYLRKVAKRKQRSWVRQKIDDHWID